MQCLYEDTKLRRKAEDGRKASYIYRLRCTGHLGVPWCLSNKAAVSEGIPSLGAA